MFLHHWYWQTGTKNVKYIDLKGWGNVLSDTIWFSCWVFSKTQLMLERLLRKYNTEYLWDFFYWGRDSSSDKNNHWCSCLNRAKRDVKLCLHSLWIVKQKEVRENHSNWICKSQTFSFILTSWEDDSVLIIKDGKCWPKGLLFQKMHGRFIENKEGIKIPRVYWNYYSP